MTALTVDLLIIGGGINGCGIAAEAAERGLSVVLVERSDLAAYTSSASSKLIHGGLRYLEYGELGLVRSALKERTTLQRIAPNLVKPERFFLPDKKQSLKIRAGLFLYDHLTSIPQRECSTKHECSGTILDEKYDKGFEYFDCKTNDSRLVIANAQKAKQSGAIIYTYSKIENVMFTHGNTWDVTVRTSDRGSISIEASHIVNATGPWVNETLKTTFDRQPSIQIRHVKGSHIIVPRVPFKGALTLPLDDGRVIFAIPYAFNTTLIGTTEVEISNLAEGWRASKQEISYLIDSFNQFVKKEYRLSEQHIINTFAGVRPLIDDGASNATAATRDYVIDRHPNTYITNVYGGKITTFRKLAVDVIDGLKPRFPHIRESVSHLTSLPGNEYSVKTLTPRIAPYIHDQIVQRWIETYGTRVFDVINLFRPTHKLVNRSIHETEILYLIRNEFVQRASDVVYGRTGLGYFTHFSEESIEEIQTFINNNR